MFANRQSITVFLFVVVWLALFALGLYNHEFWRDEVRALSIAISAPSFSNLPLYLKNEGHPILWYAVLKLAYELVHSNWVLPAVSFIFSFGIVMLIMWRSPFPLLVKALLIFGIYCLYEYGINCRNYGIAAFFMLLFADIISRQPKYIFIGFICLSLSALSNVYAAFLVIFIAAYTANEYRFNYGMSFKLVVALLVLIASIAFSVYVMIPDKASLVASRKVIDFVSIQEIWVIGNGFDGFLNSRIHFSSYVLSLILLACLLVFLPRLKAIVWMVLALLSMTFFSLCIKGNLMHHQGMYFYSLITMVWIQYEEIKQSLLRKNLISFLVLIGVLANVFVIGIQVMKCYDSYMDDWMTTKSESKAFGTWCNKQLSTSDLLIAEPDYTMEGVMFYHRQSYFIPRENTFGTYVHFTTANRAFLSLDTLMMKADTLSKSYKDIYLVFDKPVKNIDTTYAYSYSKKFKLTRQACQTLYNKYQLIDSFTHNFHNEENFYVYKRNK